MSGLWLTQSWTNPPLPRVSWDWVSYALFFFFSCILPTKFRYQSLTTPYGLELSIHLSARLPEFYRFFFHA
ncbi:MAG TPA: hypothetical protein VEI95_12105, partial [Acidobacteriota bacterium]|nr:hypothetical protein [Acidobacteriota bacterium]